MGGVKACQGRSPRFTYGGVMGKSKRINTATSRALGTVRKFFPSVNEVVDGDADIILEVTGNDVKNSRRKAHDGCALAVGAQRQLDIRGVIVGVRTAYLIKENRAIRFNVPEHAAREIISFDRGASFEPGTYKLKKPTCKLGKGKPHGADKGGHTKPKQRQIPTSNIRSVLGSDTVK
jgi:hypothetical protein